MTNEEELAKIISSTREIETILKEKFNANGKGIHTYLDSIENKIDNQLLKDLRFIATIRNKSMHESSFKVDNFNRYENVVKKSIIKLNSITIKKGIEIRPKRGNNIQKENNKSYSFIFKIIVLFILFLIFKDTNISYLMHKDRNNLYTPVSNIGEEINENINNLSYKTYTQPKVTSNFKCEGKTYCSQMSSCEEATFYINNCPDTKMDGDGDGIPCRRQWCH